MLPIAMILGAILYNPITVLNEKLPHLTQALIFAMLLVPYCRISLRELRIERLHIWLITIQIIGIDMYFGSDGNGSGRHHIHVRRQSYYIGDI